MTNLAIALVACLGVAQALPNPYFPARNNSSAVTQPESVISPGVFVSIKEKTAKYTEDKSASSTEAFTAYESKVVHVSASASEVASTLKAVSPISSISASGSTSTVTHESTTIITITSCSDNKCHESTVAATQGPTTVTVDGTTTVYTTWCPLTAETVTSSSKTATSSVSSAVSSSASSSASYSNPTSTVTHKTTTFITVTSCSDNECHESKVPATQGPTTVTTDGTITVYTTWCPLTNESSTDYTKTETISASISIPTSTVIHETTTIITITSCSDNKCHESTVPATQGPTTITTDGTITVYTTWCPLTSESSTGTTKTETVTTQSTTSSKTSATFESTTVTETSTTSSPTTTVTKTTPTLTTTGTESTLAPTTMKSSSVATSSSSTIPPSVSQFVNGAGQVGASFALIAFPLAFLL